MSNSRRLYNTPVAYQVSKNDNVVFVSNKHTALLIFDLWCNQSIECNHDAIITMHAVMPPTPWPTWSRRHIISLLNGCWTKSLIAKKVISDGTATAVKDFRHIKSWADNYEYLSMVIYESMSQSERAALNNALMYPQVLAHIMRSFHPSVAMMALKLDGMTKYPDGTSTLKHLPKIWKYLKVDSSAFKK